MGAALYEDMAIDADGKVAHSSRRNYRIPAFADTCDRLGPFGAKSMSESRYDLVAAALANVTGVGIRCLPLRTDRVLAALLEAEIVA
jgi:putative selenate reductase molybdopterin-binding subunit